MKKFSLLAVSVILVLLFINLLNNYSDRFEKVTESLEKGTSVCLTNGVKEEQIAKVVYGYVKDSLDARFIAKHLAENLRKGNELDALSDLEKRLWQVPADSIDSVECNVLYERRVLSEENLGQDSVFLIASGSALPSEKVLDERFKEQRISVSVTLPKDSASRIDKLLRRDNVAGSGIVVRLKQHYMDSLDGAMVPVSKVVCWLKTDGKGNAVFSGLDPNASYSVLPICKGYEFGTPKGTVGNVLSECAEDGELKCSFTGKEHKIRLFNGQVIKRFKADKTVVVRTPQDFSDTLLFYAVLFFSAWWGLYAISSRKRKNANVGLMSILMLLTGLCLLTMFSLNDPLVDRLLGVEMAQGVVAGVVIMGLLQGVDFTRLYQNRLAIGFDVPLECFKWMFKPYKAKVRYLTETLGNRRANLFSKLFALAGIVLCLPLLLLDLVRLTALSAKIDSVVEKLPKGTGYLLLSLLLTLLLFTPLGSDVGGMKVNLNIGIKFQPSEIAKYLIVFFMAAFFCVNADSIVKYSAEGNLKMFKSKAKMMGTVILGLGFLMVLYMALGDMGPALVLAFTFIILYSIVKSKIELADLDEKTQVKRILTCDLAMLVYGVASFVLMLYVGYLVGYMKWFPLVWIVMWVLIGLKKKQIFESAIFFNFILWAFIFGADILGNVSSLESVANRLESRNEMCTNTWGTLPLDGAEADAGENTQVAEGLWALSTGGLWGQGMGNGSPQVVPAFHTDMILESIGEQMGFVGIVTIVLLLAVLLRKTILVGYRTSHPFAFYVCLGFAIVTAVQFIVISLGSSGMIPLTGVTVPFFSYGKVSMILNLTAFGVILAIARNTNDAQQEGKMAELARQNMGKYNYSVAILSCVYTLLAIFICGVFFYYQIIVRDGTLIRPVYVNNADGVPVLEYNPRIGKVTRVMPAGDIYDRNGVLLATSDISKLEEFKDFYEECGLVIDADSLNPQARYYPFGKHLAFMLGDYNSDLYVARSENVGYAAEWRHLSELRGFDNQKAEDGTELQKVVLESDSYRESKWMPKTKKYTRNYQLYNYERLIPYLKEGLSAEDIEDSVIIGDVEPKDLHLTIDAKLQTVLQDRIAEFVDKQREPQGKEGKPLWGPERNKTRISVVILNAENGDLLASANYPMVDYERLANVPTTEKYYNDNRRPMGWRAYTDVDLGMMHFTAPGSTAKVMSAMAGFSKLGTEVNGISYKVTPAQTVGIEPGQKYSEVVSAKDAITRSSNCYFINLVNQYDLYSELDTIYSHVGINIAGKNLYTLDYADREKNLEVWRDSLRKEVSEGDRGVQGRAIDRYNKYLDKNGKFKDDVKMNRHTAWQLCWGQGKMTATPLAIARVASAVVNGGKMPKTRILLSDSPAETIEFISKDEANMLAGYMVDENHQKLYKSNQYTGAKTGTAERVLKGEDNGEMDLYGKKPNEKGYRGRPNDAWYMTFWKRHDIVTKDGVKQSDPLAIAVRIERTTKMSGEARALAEEVVFDVLKELGYIDKFKK